MYIYIYITKGKNKNIACVLLYVYAIYSSKWTSSHI